MDWKKSVLERAFDLARSGECQDLLALRKRLNSEGYECTQVQGPMLIKQLKALIEEAGK